MKKVLVILFSFLTIYASAKDYYISSTGNDSADGLSPSTPWQTINKVNSVFSSLKAGDRILFKRGDTFYGTLKISKSGISGNNIIISAYGTGNNPVISGFKILSSWNDEGNGIYSHSYNSDSYPEIVLINDTQYPMGRYPNSGWLKYESHIGNVSITDVGLGNIPNWEGAEIVIRKNNYTIDRCVVTNHSGDILTYESLNNSSSNATNNYGYFIQNDFRTLDGLGEWFCDGTNLYMYFGIEQPSNFSVKVAHVDNLLYASGISNVTVENITFYGANLSSVYIEGSKSISINNCEIIYSGLCAIQSMWHTSSFLTINNNRISNSNGTAIFLIGANSIITNNFIENTGLIPGSTKDIAKSQNGIYIYQSDNSLIQNNKIINTGYDGIYVNGNNTLVRNNYIDKFCLNRIDGGGIYVSMASTSYKGIVIDGNIIINGIGNYEGTSVDPSSWDGAEGIYLDAPTYGVSVINNTVANCNTGIKIHESHDLTITENTFYNNRWDHFLCHFGTNPSHLIRNIVMESNLSISRHLKQLSLFYYSIYDDLNKFGLSNNNYYARPVDDDDVFNTYTPSTGSKYRTLAGWQALTGQDLNSKKSPVAVKDTADIKFYYNASKKDTVISLVQPMLDVKGTSYVNSVTLAPFSSIILIVDPDPPVPVVPVYVSSLINNFSPTKVELTYTVNLDPSSLPLPSDFTVMVNGIARNVTSVEISGNKVILILASPVLFGDMVSVSYTQNPGRPLQTSSLGLAANLTEETVKNNIADPAVKNSPPAISVSYEEDVFSGFVCEIDASATIDDDNDDLTFSWKTPPDIPVSSLTGPVIRFLTPIVSTPQTLTFQLSVNDGKAESSTSLSVTNKPYKPELRMGNVKIIEASNFFQPHHPINVDDNNLNTRWSVEGDNQWITISLADPLKINHIQVALMPGQHYESYFDLFASVDNIFWEPLLQNGVSCSFSGYPQNFNLPADKLNTEYSYVKLLAHGNELDNWNNYSEIKIFGSPGDSRNSPEDPENISIYPNPARDHINVMVLEPVTETQTLRVADMAGNVRFETTIDPGAYNTQIPVNLTSGVYIVQVLLGNFIRFAQTLIITR